MRRKLMSLSYRGERLEYEVVDGERVIVGADVSYADVVVANAELGRYQTSFQFERGGLTVIDMQGGRGTRLRGQRLYDVAPVDVGEVVHIGPVEATISEFDAGLLDDIHVTGGYVLYGRRRMFGAGRWPAFRWLDGCIERALVVGWPPRHDSDLGAVAAPTWFDRDVEFFACPAADGVLASTLLHAMGHNVEAQSVARAIRVQVHRAQEGKEASDVVITWDGRVVVVPSRRRRPFPGDDAIRVGAQSSRERARAAAAASDVEIPPAHDALIMRGLFQDEWRAEVELREQLDTLDEEGVRWLLERNQRTP